MPELDFTPSVKTIEKMRLIYLLKRQGKTWDQVAVVVGHRKRYCSKLYRYYIEEMKEERE